MKKLILALGLSLASVMLLAETLGERDFKQKTCVPANVASSFIWENGVLKCSLPVWPKDVKFIKQGVRTDIPQSFAGHLVEFSAETRWMDAPAEGGKKQGYIQFAMFRKNGETAWDGIRINPAQKDWTSFRKIIRVPADLKLFRLVIGFENACGNFEIRNIELKDLGMPVDLASYANRAVRDSVAGDGTGGWTDQGPMLDGRAFEPEFRKNFISGAPFCIPVDNLNPNKKTVMVMRSATRNPNGILEQEIPVAPTKANYLYVLHALSYPGANGSSAGRIIVTTESGAKTELPVIVGRDLGDWYQGKPVTNGSDALRVKGRSAEYVLYATRYALPQTDQKIVSVRFISDNEDKVWIIAGATLSETKYDLAAVEKKQPLIIKANAEWQQPLRTMDYHYRKPGSVLDVTPYADCQPVTEETRIVIRGNRFYRKNDMTAPMRFFCATGQINLGYPRSLDTKEKIKTYVEDMKLHGYNMLQIYVSAVMKGMTRVGEFNEQALDLFDYFFDLCAKNGIYVDLILMPRRSGFFTYKELWGNPPYPFGDNEPNVSFGIYFDKKFRDNWEMGVVKLLNHKNKYNGRLWKEDPVILLYGADNEQEYAFNFKNIVPRDQKVVIGPYREFLKNRYKTIDAYNAKWKTKFASFDEIPCFDVKNKNEDVNEFLYQKSVELLKWEKSVLAKIGAKGYLGETMNFVKSMTYHFIRREMDFVSMHVYHDHPLGNISGRGGYNRQMSAINTGNQFFRTLAGSRHFNKPFICSEYDQPFWNRYRYERSFMIGAYAALNSIDGLTVWSEPVKRFLFSNTRKEPWHSSTLSPFRQSTDPLGDASQLLTYFMYIRGDVQPAKNFIRITADRASVFATDPLAAPAPEQTALSLLTGYWQESVDVPKQIRPAAKNEVVIPSLGGGKMRIEGFFTEAVGATRNISKTIAELKKKGVLTQDNRSNGENIFESSTKELYMDMEKSFMTVNTPRLQGMCGLAGATAKLSDFEVVSHNVEGNLTLAAVDGLAPIRSAKRLLLVRLTNALNTDMAFTDKDMTQLESLGRIPALLRNSKFTVRVRNANAAALKLYPLSLEGIPTGKVLAPVSVKGDVATFTADTAKDGNTVYFEIR
ncbi:MAG: beta-galactosidase [bacterium]|nr:beta-galactosidase [bacterium]